MSVRTISPELLAAFKRLRSGGSLPAPAARLTLADKHSTTFEDFLLKLFTDEISSFDANPDASDGPLTPTKKAA